MSGMRSTADRVVLIEYLPGNLDVTTHESFKEMVFDLLNSGSMADGEWGSEQHLAVLALTVSKIQEIQKAIERALTDKSDPRLSHSAEPGL